MAGQIDADVEALREDIGQMRADFAKLSETLQTLVKDGGSEAFDRLRGSTERLKDDLTRTAQSLSHEIEERPIAAAVTAFVAGMVIAALFSRRS